jgi:hypothetical protein
MCLKRSCNTLSSRDVCGLAISSSSSSSSGGACGLASSSNSTSRLLAVNPQWCLSTHSGSSDVPSGRLWLLLLVQVLLLLLVVLLQGWLLLLVVVVLRRWFL